MKALSVRQPWAFLIVYGFKDVENRSWVTKHRGPLLIHAGKAAMTKADWAHFREICENLEIPLPAAEELPCGGIVGAVNLSDCVQQSKSPWWDGEPYAWEFSHSIHLDFFPCKGALQLFEVPGYDPGLLEMEKNFTDWEDAE